MNGRRLYEEIGGVDERYLQQAANYRAKSTAPAWRVLLVAAVLALAGALVLGTIAASVAAGLIGGLIFGNKNKVEGPNQEVEHLTLLEQMERAMATEQSTLRPLSEQEIDLFSNGATLIWTDGESGDYYRVSLSYAECEDLIGLMHGARKEVSESSEKPNYQLWISLGNGEVVSPYLKNSAGNIGHGALFDYDPELELSEEIINLVIDCVQS